MPQVSNEETIAICCVHNRLDSYTEVERLLRRKTDHRQYKAVTFVRKKREQKKSPFFLHYAVMRGEEEISTALCGKMQSRFVVGVLYLFPLSAQGVGGTSSPPLYLFGLSLNFNSVNLRLLKATSGIAMMANRKKSTVARKRSNQSKPDFDAPQKHAQFSFHIISAPSMSVDFEPPQYPK
jgi:hypothetical protein